MLLTARRWPHRAAAAVLTGMLVPAMPLASGDGASCAQTPPPETVPLARLEEAEWVARHEAKLREARSGPINLVLLGDSITEQYDSSGPDPLLDYSGVWRRFYADRQALNLGFGGDGTQHLLWRITHGEIDGLAPRAAVILIGTNDISWLHRTAAQAAAGIEAVVAEVHRRLPDTKILLVGLLPSDRAPPAAEQTAEINAALAGRYGQGEAPYVTYRDISPVFLKDGAVDPSLFRDPQATPPEPALHPSPEGQQRMAAALEPTLSGLLGDRPHGR